MSKLGWMAVIALGGGACAEPQGMDAALAGRGAYEVDVQAERAALRETDLAHSDASGSLPGGFLGFLADDAVFAFPNAPWVQGKTAIGALLSAPPAPFGAGISLGWEPVFVDVSVDAAVGYSFGNVIIPRPGLADLRGQYIAFWRKQADGSWKVEAWNMSPMFSPPAALPASFGHGLLDNGRGPFTPVDMAAEAARLLEVDAAFSRMSVEVSEQAAFGAYAHQHAILLAGGDPDFLIGRQAIAASRPEPGLRVLSWVPKVSGVGPLGDLGWSLGEFASESSGGTFVGKYLSVWRKQPNGEWKFVQDAGSGNPPPQ